MWHAFSQIQVLASNCYFCGHEYGQMSGNQEVDHEMGERSLRRRESVEEHMKDRTENTEGWEWGGRPGRWGKGSRSNQNQVCMKIH